MSAPPKLYRLVTLEEAKEQLEMLDGGEDAKIDRRIIRASQTIMDYLQGSPFLHGWTDTSGIPLVDADGNPLRIGALGVLDTAGDFVFTLDSAGNPVNAGVSIVPGHVQEACLLLIARGDDDREGDKDQLSPAIESLLRRSYVPALA